MNRRRALVAPGEIAIGEPDMKPDFVAHVPGVHQGNWPHRRARRQKERGTAPAVSGDPKRSTGISPSKHGTIDPGMPKLTPP